MRFGTTPFPDCSGPVDARCVVMCVFWFLVTLHFTLSSLLWIQVFTCWEHSRIHNKWGAIESFLILGLCILLIRISKKTKKSLGLYRYIIILCAVVLSMSVNYFLGITNIYALSDGVLSPINVTWFIFY